jgi:glycosyltransferase involved in cell wall biosynthesis
MSCADKKDVPPYFSVIMPAYNRGSMIANSIESVLAQSFQNWELIVVDDGGHDNTKEVVDAYADPRIRYFWKKNEERSIARNFGINLSRGQYINFLDSDDVQKPMHLQMAYDLIESNRLEKVFHLAFGFKDPVSGVEKIIKIPDSDQVFESLFYENNLHGNAIFVQRDIFSEIRFPESKYAVIGEDWCLWNQISARYKIVTKNLLTSYVLTHEGRSVANIDPYKYERSYVYILGHLKSDLVFWGRRNNLRQSYFYAHHTLGISLHFLINGVVSKPKAIQYMLSALMIDPRIIFGKRFLVCLKKLAFK